MVLLSEELTLSWDPGGRNFFGFFTRAEAQGRGKATAPAYYCILCLDKVYADQDYYLNVF